MTDPDDIPRAWTLSSLAALLGIALVPPWLCIWLAGAGWEVVGAGAAVWFASVIAKGPILGLLNRALSGVRSNPLKSGLHGLLSAVVELAAAGAYFAAWPPGSFAEVLAFGVGAGSAEAAYVLIMGVLGPKPDPEEIARWAQGAAVSLCVRYTVPIERLFALVGHAGSRGLVYVALQSAPLSGAIWLLAALSLFTAIDGVAVYGHREKWKWHDPAVCRRAHAFFASASVGEAVLFLLAFRLSV